MENLHTPNKTPSKLMETFPRELRDAVSATRRTNTQSSPFYILPNHLTTPPSRFIKIRNPFEAAMNDHFHKHIFSPSVFAEVQNPRNSDKFKWTIDDVSSLRPAHIDVSTIAQFEPSTSEDDVHVQAKIEKYFNETHIVPSPFSQGNRSEPLLPESESPTEESLVRPKEMCNVWTQTVLSLPSELPEAVEKALLPYFSFTDDQRRQTVDLNSSLCRRLFHFEENEESSVSSIHSEISCHGSPIMGQTDADKRKRNYDSSPENVSDVRSSLIPPELSPIPSSTPRKLSNCPISPIIVNMEDIQCRNSNPVLQNDSLSPVGFTSRVVSRSFAKADFSGHMSVDNSFNLASENEFIGGNNTNLSESPVRSNEFMESSCNWDLEYNNISISNRPIRRSLFEIRQSSEKMDISNLTTPKSKIINSQRKKLSDSFKFSESHSDEEILNFAQDENQSKFRKFSREGVIKVEENFTLSQNTQDTGYQTELSQKSSYTQDEEENRNENDDVIMSEEEIENKENWSPNIYASTPSKRYFSNLGK